MPTPTWEHAAVIANFFVAAGTIVLAGVTAWMAQQTRDEVQSSNNLVKSAEEQIKASNRQADVASEAILASIQPIIADVPYSGHTMGSNDPGYIAVKSHAEKGEPSRVQISVPFRNVGLGPARIEDVRLYNSKGLDEESTLISAHVIDVGGNTRAEFLLDASRSDGLYLHPAVNEYVFSISIEYTNAYRSNPMLAELHVTFVRFLNIDRYIVQHVDHH